MTGLVSLDLVKQILNVDFDDHDAKLSFFIDAASESVRAYLKDQADALILDGGGVPMSIQMATLFLVGRYYGEPDGNSGGDFQPGYLPAQVIALLYPLRDPALK